MDSSELFSLQAISLVFNCPNQLAVNNVFTTVSPNKDLSSIQAETNSQPTRVSLSGMLSSSSKKLNTPSSLNATAAFHSHIKGRIHSKRAITFADCSMDQQVVITQAAADATALITQSLNYLQALTGGTPRWDVSHNTSIT